MDKAALIKKVADIVRPITDELSYELYYVEYVKENGDYYLRIYINKKDGRISLNDCEAVSRRISPILDEVDPIEGAYYLEVSSPGLNRKLYTKEHFKDVIGKEISVQFNGTLEGLKRIKGTLIEVSDDFIQVNGEKNLKIINDKIKSANLEGEI